MNILDISIKKSLQGEVPAKLKDFVTKENDKGGYVQLILVLPDREYNYNIFGSNEAQATYVASALRTQIGKTDEDITLREILEFLKESQTEFKAWFSWNKEYATMNVAFHNSDKSVNVEELEEVL